MKRLKDNLEELVLSFTMWDLGIKLRLLGLMTGTFYFEPPHIPHMVVGG